MRERERIEQEERDRERMERERREESQERGVKKARTDTDTDVESTQSRQKKGQVKSIFFSDSDEEAIMEFVYDKTNDSFKYKQNKERLWESLLASSYQELGCQDCEEVIRDSTYQIWQAHSDEVRTSS